MLTLLRSSPVPTQCVVLSVFQTFHNVVFEPRPGADMACSGHAVMAGPDLLHSLVSPSISGVTVASGGCVLSSNCRVQCASDSHAAAAFGL